MKKITWIILLMLVSVKGYSQRKLEQMDPEKQEETKKAQDQEERRKAAGPKWYDKMNFGGSASMFFSTVGSQFSIQPFALYNITEKLAGGAGFSYYYYSINYNTSTGTQTLSNNAYGANLFSRLKVFDEFFLQAEYMPMNTSIYRPLTNTSERQWVDAFLVGGGQLQPFSDRAGGYFVILYDLMYNEQRSFSPSPLHIRLGLYF